MNNKKNKFGKIDLKNKNKKIKEISQYSLNDSIYYDKINDDNFSMSNNLNYSCTIFKKDKSNDKTLNNKNSTISKIQKNKKKSKYDKINKQSSPLIYKSIKDCKIINFEDKSINTTDILNIPSKLINNTSKIFNSIFYQNINKDIKNKILQTSSNIIHNNIYTKNLNLDKQSINNNFIGLINNSLYCKKKDTIYNVLKNNVDTRYEFLLELSKMSLSKFVTYINYISELEKFINVKANLELIILNNYQIKFLYKNSNFFFKLNLNVKDNFDSGIVLNSNIFNFLKNSIIADKTAVLCFVIDNYYLKYINKSINNSNKIIFNYNKYDNNFICIKFEYKIDISFNCSYNKRFGYENFNSNPKFSCSTERFSGKKEVTLKYNIDISNINKYYQFENSANYINIENYKKNNSIIKDGSIELNEDIILNIKIPISYNYDIGHSICVSNLHVNLSTKTTDLNILKFFDKLNLLSKLNNKNDIKYNNQFKLLANIKDIYCEEEFDYLESNFIKNENLKDIYILPIRYKELNNKKYTESLKIFCLGNNYKLREHFCFFDKTNTYNSNLKFKTINNYNSNDLYNFIKNNLNEDVDCWIINSLLFLFIIKLKIIDYEFQFFTNKLIKINLDLNNLQENCNIKNKLYKDYKSYKNFNLEIIYSSEDIILDGFVYNIDN